MPPAASDGSTHPSEGAADAHVIPWKPAANPEIPAEPAARGVAAGVEIFASLDEVGLEGWRSLRALVLACRRVILWAPSLSRLEALRNYDRSLPSAEEVVAWVRSGRIQILARDSWMDGESRDGGKRAAGAIGEAYDRIGEMLRQDVREGRVGLSARVRRAPAAKDLAWAFNEFWHSDVNLTRLHREALAHLPGYVENAARLGDHRLASIELLRDLRNRGEAFLFSGADRELEAPKHRIALGLVLASTAAPRGEGERTAPPPVNANALALAILTAVADARRRDAAWKAWSAGERESARGLVLGPDGIAALRTWIAGCDAWVERGFGNPLSEMADWLFRSLIAELPGGPPAEVAAMTSLQKVAFIGSVGMGLAAHAEGETRAPLSMGQLPVAGVSAMLRRLSQLPDGFAGVRWPYYVAEDPESPFRATREAVVATLTGGQ
jgi:hypothetical protein